MKNYRHIGLSLLLSGILVSCIGQEIIPESPEYEGTRQLHVKGYITQVNITRAADSGFADGDQIGVYVVNYGGDDPGVLSTIGNHADNVRHTYVAAEDKWVPSRRIYWKDDYTMIDAYSYYPYRDEVDDVHAIPISAQRNQSAPMGNTNITGYQASDFLWAKATAVSPSVQIVNMNHKHVMAGLKIKLVPGDGFTAESWAAATKTVLVENTYSEGRLDLATGVITPDTDSEINAIIPLENNGEYRAVVIPQTVEARKKMMSITLDGNSYAFSRDEMTTFLPGKLHHFTIMVHSNTPYGDYRFELKDEAVTAWESDTESHSGKVMEYRIINVPEAGTLPDVISASGIDPKSIINLKIVGELTYTDFDYIRDNIKQLEALNLYECRIRNCEFEYNGIWEDDVMPSYALSGMSYLTDFVFPKHLKRIGAGAFDLTQLTGSLIIPEGVTHIGEWAFQSRLHQSEIENHLYGSLSLPSTLEYIGRGAFARCIFTSELRIPENVKHIGDEAFVNCSRMTGMLVLPKGLTYLGSGAFGGMTNITGTVEIPDGIDYIDNGVFEGTGITGVIIPETVNAIRSKAFCSTSLEGDLILPQSLREIGENAFQGTNITSIRFPDELDYIPHGAFADSKCLQDTLKLPENLLWIDSYAFGNCSKLDAIILPHKLESMGERAFANCFSIGYIRSEAVEPPSIHSNTFEALPKDNFTVEVPEESVAAYRSASDWNEFKRISAYKGFVSRPSFANVLNAGGTRELILNAPSETGWQVVYCPDWCHLSATSGIGKTQLQLTIDPMPHNADDRYDRIVLRLDGEEEYLTYIDVGQYDYMYDEDQQVSLQRATKGNGIDVFIVGDGYDAIDISDGMYLEDMRQEMEYFFGVEPYKTYREYFNFYTAIALSYESGIGTVNTLRNVKFGTTYGNGTWESRLNGDGEEVVRYAVDHVDAITEDNIDKLTAILIPNAEAYDGVCQMWTNGTAVAFCPKSNADYPNDARGILQHEACGHGFGKLADEYIYHTAFIQTCSCTCCPHVDQLLSKQAIGWYRNISLNSKFKTVQWSHLIYDDRYNDIVDIYEGAHYHSRGVYRSEFNSCMNNNVPYFSTISRQAIVERIMDYAGEDFDFEKFVANDDRSWGIDFTDPAQTKSMDTQIPYATRHTGAPVIIEGSPLD